MSRVGDSQMKPARCDRKRASCEFNKCVKLPGAKSYVNIIDLNGSALPSRPENTKNRTFFYLFCCKVSKQMQPTRSGLPNYDIYCLTQ